MFKMQPSKMIRFQTDEKSSPQRQRLQFHIIGAEDLDSTKSHASTKRPLNAYVGMKVTMSEGHKTHYYTTSTAKCKSPESDVVWYDNLGPMLLPSSATISFEVCTRSSISRTTRFLARTASYSLSALVKMQGDLTDRDSKISLPLLTEPGSPTPQPTPSPSRPILNINIRELASAQLAQAEVKLAQSRLSHDENRRSSIEKEPLSEPEDDLTRGVISGGGGATAATGA
ncbi:hypothetical protein D9758_005927 [Tetrapyrgos nigripes]|uniref:C2 domain-containing protein n=1 Tax=Tetrapyrgos nigripes TaxID=182062 RepID=A0A8H5LHJ7_9AGAR|nr:hypothetical protein D9758_005927 [Tetrapyrgos nigripes]